ncbi:HAMP domain-containing sensor histidine kinase [Enterococcus alishanensis]|uniref:histidine kinase n=1 Tax=Enterococcus alishanensis TaxID=1303817 RepID=A0ABS6TGP5_9ENTE|nr:HAMP domain-containing sensor histidine kinase [Enterococcus alishanensis]MBV7392084.1 HAMP domain-containing histidine kinase [Enterococcus alishanensis]
MAKKQSIGLTNYVTRILFMAFGGTFLIILLIVATFLVMLQTNFIAPSNIGETAARNTIEDLTAQGHFSTNFDTSYFNYIYFNAEGEVVSSSLQNKELTDVKKRYENLNQDYSNGAYLKFSDGSYSLFVWQYQALFTNVWLRRCLPRPEFLFFGITLLLLVLYSVFIIRFASKNLSSKISLINQASQQVARQDLDSPIKMKSGIKEFDSSLNSMEEMRQTLKNSLVQQWQAQQQQKQDLAALSHDIKTPLTIISGNSELLLEDELTAPQKESVRAIFESSQRAQHYLQVLQQVSNFDLQMKEKTEMSVKALLKEIDEILRPLAKQKNLLITYSFPEGLKIFADVFNLVRALITLGENAINYSTVGEIKISVTKEDNYINFVFEDTGPGFSDEGLKHATEMFWQQDQSRSTNVNYGIGLALAKKVAEDHGGKINIENKNGGARVTLVIES